MTAEWIAAVVDEHCRGVKSEAGRPLLSWAQHRYAAAKCREHSSVTKTTSLLNWRFGTSFRAQNVVGTLFRFGVTTGRRGYFSGPPHNTLPLGAESVHLYKKDGRRELFVKVAEPNPYLKTTGGHMRPKRLVVWEAVHGPVPDGHAVVFLDGDYRNCDIDNLALVERGELAILNRQVRWQQLPPDRDTRRAAVAVARLTRISHKRVREVG